MSAAARPYKSWRKLVCIVEGHGEQWAVPSLCRRILKQAQITGWEVATEAIRHPRGRLLKDDALRNVLEMARRQGADGALVLCDADDASPCPWGPRAAAAAREVVGAGDAVMAVREFEAWLLFSGGPPQGGWRRNPETIRNAKGELEGRWGRYIPTLHQKDLAEKIDIDAVRAVSRSFDKLVRAVVGICSATTTASPQKR